MKKIKIIREALFLSFTSLALAIDPGILNVGFDIDDTVLYSKDVFLKIPKDKRNPIDYGWVNKQDEQLSKLIEPTVDLINYFKNNGHNIYFITARSDEEGNFLAKFLSKKLYFKIEKDRNLFFCPKETTNGKRFTTKHIVMQELDLDLFYGDADSDMIAALKANVHPIRIIRHENSINQYGGNYFGNTLGKKTKTNPFGSNDLKIFYSKGVGLFGESIYPIIWEIP